MAEQNLTPDNQNDWVTIAYTHDRMEAESISALLRSEDIPVFIKQEGAGRAIGLTVGILGKIEVMVSSEHADLAISLLDKRHQFD